MSSASQVLAAAAAAPNKDKQISQDVLQDAIISEMQKIYDNGGSAKGYGVWGTISKNIYHKMQVQVDGTVLRKKWEQMEKTYKKHVQALSSTGGEGYNEYWRNIKGRQIDV